MKRIFAAVAVMVVAALGGGLAHAAWLAPAGSGFAQASATSVGAGNTPTVGASGSSVTVSWTATTLVGGTAVTGYVINRYNSSDVAQTIGDACSGTIAALTCTEIGVAAGTWKYSVTPVRGNWTGGESAKASVTVTGAVLPSITISSLVIGAGQSVSATGTSNLASGTTFGVVLCSENVWSCAANKTHETVTATVGSSGNWTTTSSGNLNKKTVYARATYTNAAGTGTSNVAGPVTP